MKKPDISERASRDLDEIWLYIAQDNPKNADGFVARIHQKCQMLAESPGIGRQRPELEKGMRSHAVGKYLIFYRPTDTGITVVRVLSGYRDLPVLFEKE